MNSTHNLCLLFAFVCLLGCKPDDKLTGVAAGARGRYVVTHYIVSGDTLFSLLPGSTGYKPGINKVDVTNFTISIDVIESDQLILKTVYGRKGLQSAFSKKAVVRLTNYNYEFSLLQTNPPSAYEGSVGRFSGFFYERTTGGGLLIPLADSVTNPVPFPSQEVIIIAQPVR